MARKTNYSIIIVLLILIIPFFCIIPHTIRADASYVEILHPIISVPLIQEKGGDIIVEVDSDATLSSNWIATITTKYDSFSLIVNNVISDSTGWKLNVTIPSVVRADLYDLSINVDGVSDTNQHSISVVDEFKDEFSFIQFTDIHIKDSPSSNENYFKQAILEANLIRPEFVIITGDIADNPEGVGQDEIAEYQRVYDLLLMLEVPVYVVNGNHDYDSDLGEPSPIFTYRDMINPYANFSFNYGKYHFIGLDSGEKAAYYGLPGCMMGTGLTDEQITWLENDLSAHSNRQTYIFMHHTAFDPDKTKAFGLDWNSSISQNQQELLDIVNQNNVMMVLTGHTHDDEVWDKYGNKFTGGSMGDPTPPLYVQTRATGKDSGGSPGYRLIRVNRANISSFTYDWDGNRLRDNDKSIPSDHLTVEYLPSNNGTARTVTAKITNDLREEFANVFLEFVMPKLDTEYETIIRNGVIDQIIEYANSKIYYVRADLPVLTTKHVSLTQDILPVSSFSYSPPRPTTTDTVQFTDLSVDSDGTITSWRWDFGDGDTSGHKNPSHKYSSPGTYTIRLTVTDNNGVVNTIIQNISIGNMPPIADFSYSPINLTIKDTIQFNDESTDSDGTIVTWLWDFGDGVTSSQKNPTHKYSNPETYTIKLIVTDSDGEASICIQNIRIENISPIADFSYLPSTITTEDTVQFADYSMDEDGTIVTWSWIFEDGSTSSIKNPTHKYSKAGDYTVKLTVTDDNGAIDTMMVIITVKEITTIAESNIEEELPVLPIFHLAWVYVIIMIIIGVILLFVWKWTRRNNSNG